MKDLVIDGLVSIITVCYNAEKTIEQTINSVLNQTYPNIEYIIVDGKSTDGTLEIVNKYREKIACVISEKDNGIYDAMNKGIAISHGFLIGIINADDWYEYDAVENVLKSISEDKDHIGVISGCINIYDNNQLQKRTYVKEMESIWDGMFIAHPATFIKKEIYNTYGKYCIQYKIAADYDLLLQLYVNGVEFRLLDKIIANFRIGGVSTIKQKELLIEDIDIIQKNISNAKDMEFARQSIERRKRTISLYETNTIEVRRALELVKYYNVCIFGMGYWGHMLYQFFIEWKISVNCVVDNNAQLWGKKMGEIVVQSPQILEDYKGVIIIAMANNFQCVQEQIENLIKENVKIVTLNEFMDSIVYLGEMGD